VPFTVTDLRQYAYCPRIPYYTYVVPLSRPVTPKMREGLVVHDEQGEREQRRNLSKFGLKGQAERYEDVALFSPHLGLSGRLDMVLVTPGEAIPVEYKNGRGPVGVNHRLQLTAAALLVEERWQRPVRRAFVHFVPTGRRTEVAITPELRVRVEEELAALHRMVERETMPPPTSVVGRCIECEFRRFCNDRP
jgi:CRISPR-associated exonuclease Cas4